MARKALSKSVRFEVFKRDSFTCQYCGATAPNVVLNVDHIEPVANGGTNDLLNLITSCEPCNAGKSDRRLSDDTAMSKKRSQLEELQVRQEQIELMMQWQKGLLGLERTAEQAAADFWAELVSPYVLTEQGSHELAGLVHKFTLPGVLDAMKIAARQYIELGDDDLPTDESVARAWEYVGRICTVKKADAEKPYLKDLFYVRGIVRKRFDYCDERQALKLLEEAYLKGVPIDLLKEIARETRNWSSWRDVMTEILGGA